MVFIAEKIILIGMNGNAIYMSERRSLPKFVQIGKGQPLWKECNKNE